MSTLKKCVDCSETKSLTEFYKDKGLRDGHASRCKICKNKLTLVWRAANKEEYNAAQRKQHKKNYQRNRLYRYKLTPEQHAAMLTAQNSRCAICDKAPKGKRPLVIDHDHKTGANRALLCYGCNRALHVLETETLLSKAMAYLAAHKKL